MGTVYHDGTTATIEAARKTGAHRIVNINSKLLAAYSYSRIKKYFT